MDVLGDRRDRAGEPSQVLHAYTHHSHIDTPLTHTHTTNTHSPHTPNTHKHHTHTEWRLLLMGGNGLENLHRYCTHTHTQTPHTHKHHTHTNTTHTHLTYTAWRLLLMAREPSPVLRVPVMQ